MGKHIIEYKMHGVTIPYFVEDGGYFPENGKYIGISKDDTDCHLPETVVKLTNEEFSSKIQAKTLKNSDGDTLTTQQKSNIITAFINKTA